MPRRLAEAVTPRRLRASRLWHPSTSHSAVSTLLVTAGLGWSGVLLPLVVRHAPFPCAGLCSAERWLAVSSCLTPWRPRLATPPNYRSSCSRFLRLEQPGSFGQVLNQVDQRRADRQLLERIAELEANLSGTLNAVIESLVPAHTEIEHVRSRRAWWRSSFSLRRASLLRGTSFWSALSACPTTQQTGPKCPSARYDPRRG